jgi:hypothetical protein
VDTVQTNNGKKGGLLKGKPHYDKNGKSLGGIKAVVTDAGGKPVELEGGEVIINKEASKKHWKTLSQINQSAGNGVPIGPPQGADEDPDEYKEGGKVISFNPNHIPNKWVYQYAKTIKTKHPEIWKLGGNIFGNEAFINLERVLKRGHWLDSEEWMYVKWRSYVARHKGDFRIEGVVAMLKWCDKVEKGWAYMKDLIEEKIDKIESKSKKFSEGGGVGHILDDDGNNIELKIGDVVVEYRKPTPNQEKRIIGPEGKIINIVGAMAKVSFNSNYEEWLALKDLKKVTPKKVDTKMSKGGIPKENTGGNCYEVAGNIAMDKKMPKSLRNKTIKFNGTPYLVHAQVTGQGAIDNVKYGHAWVEDDVFVYDFSNGRELIIPKELYYFIGKIEMKKPIYYRYPFDVAVEKMLSTEHYGPWELKTESGL